MADPRLRRELPTAGNAAGVEKRPLFYFDLGCPYAYLAAERVATVLPIPPIWRLAERAAILRASGRDDWMSGPAELRLRHLSEIERRARERDLLPLRWPELQVDTRRAMLAAAFAQGTGRLVAFSLAAFRHAYAAGRSLARDETILLAAAACELHPRAVLAGIDLDSTRARLERSTAEALAAGVRMLPAVVWEGRVFHGDDSLEAAASAIAA